MLPSVSTSIRKEKEIKAADGIISIGMIISIIKLKIINPIFEYLLVTL